MSQAGKPSVGILGAGLMGRALGRHWARSGREVRYSFARDRAKLEAIAAEDGPTARAATPAEAAQCDVVLLAVPWRALDTALEQAGDLAGKVVLSCSLPMRPDDGALALGHTMSGAEDLAERLPGARVVSIFNTVPSELITALALEATTAAAKAENGSVSVRPQVVACGDDAGAKAIAMDLARDAGFEPVDAGPLRVARLVEPFGLLMAQLAYEQGTYGGPEVGYRFFAAGGGQ